MSIDLTKMNGRRANPLGAPPKEASNNLSQPELAPAALPSPPKPFFDGRSRRRSKRTAAFTTKFSPEMYETIVRIAEEEDILYVEVIEMALDALVKERAKK